MAYVDTEKLKRNIRVNLMPNVDVDGTVTVENAERCFLNLIDKTSTADVVEVVRCKDCKRYEKAEYFSYDSEDATKNVCRLLSRQMQEDDFCSDGERNANE